VSIGYGPDENFLHCGDRDSIANNAECVLALIEVCEEMTEAGFAVLRQNEGQFCTHITV